MNFTNESTKPSTESLFFYTFRLFEKFPHHLLSSFYCTVYNFAASLTVDYFSKSIKPSSIFQESLQEGTFPRKFVAICTSAGLATQSLVDLIGTARNWKSIDNSTQISLIESIILQHSELPETITS